MRVISFFWKNSKWPILIAAIGSSVAAALGITAVKILSDVLVDPSKDIYTSIGVALLLSLVGGVVAVLNNHYSINYFEYLVADVRKKFSSIIVNQDYEVMEKRSKRILPVLMIELEAISGFGKQIPEFLVSIFQILAIWIYLMVISWQLTSLIILVILLLALFVRNFSRKFYLLEKERAEIRKNLHHRFSGLVAGLKDLYMNSKLRYAYVESSIGKLSDGHASRSVALNTRQVILNKLTETNILLALGVIVLFVHTQPNFKGEMVSQFVTLLLFLLPSFIKISNAFKPLKHAESAVDQIEALGLSLNDQSVVSKPAEASADLSDPVISFQDVAFTYSGDDGFVVGPFNFDIHKNEILLIKGGNGSGKSTLFKLIAGLFKPSSGTILQGDRVISERTLEQYRNDFSCCFTDSYVFDNLAYLSGEMQENEVNGLIDELGLKEKIVLDEALVINNTNLSYGQMGRLNLLRVLLENKPIYMFDEWAANQDVHFKEKFYLEIIPALKSKGKTIILISHDDRYYHIADRIITLRNGQLESIHE